MTDDTVQVPVFTDTPDNPYRFERVLFVWLCIAYAFAGGVLSFSLFELAALADQLTAAPFCRRL